MNRLKLDFTLETATERAQFIDTYIVQFPDLTNSEAETIANYLLWGKDHNGKAVGCDLNLETKWSRKKTFPTPLMPFSNNPAHRTLS